MKQLRLPAFVLLALLSTCWLFPSRSIAQVEGSATFSTTGTTREAVVEFLGRLQAAVQADDRAEVAKLVRFPLRAWNGKTTVSVRDRKQFLAQYPSIFTASLKTTIAAAKVDNAFANWQGVMFDSGRIWIRSEDDGPLKLITINSP